MRTDAATFVEPIAAALQIQQQVKVRPENRTLVVGDGKLGQVIAQTLILTGCRLSVAGRYERKLKLLAACGTHTSVGGAVEEGVFDLVVECTGNAAGFGVARQALRPGGTMILKSTYTGRLTMDAADMVVDEISLVGSRCGPFAPALRLLAQGQVNVEPLVDARYPLCEGVEAFNRGGQNELLKVLLEMG